MKIIASILTSIVLLMTFFPSAFGQSVNIPGNDDKKFREAIDFYLEDNDEIAIPMLAQLAKDGNIAAQLFLGRVDSLKSSSFIDRLSRDKRIALMREGSGKFGKSWLLVLSEKLPIAKAFLQAQSARDYIQGGRALSGLGENRAAIEAYRGAAFQGQFKEIMTAAQDDLVPDGGRYLIWAAAISLPPNPKLKAYLDEFASAVSANDVRAVRALNNAVVENPVLRRFYFNRLKKFRPLVLGNLLDHHRVDREVLKAAENWLAKSDATAPIALLCRRTCPDNPNGCARAAYFSIDGYRGVEADYSPIETIIPQSVYRNSLRVQANILRKAQARFKPYGNANVLAETSACFARLVISDDRK